MGADSSIIETRMSKRAAPRMEPTNTEPVGVREVDWPLIEGALAVRPTLKSTPTGPLHTLPKNATLLGLGFAAVEGLRRALGLDRIALFLLSKSGRFLSGLVGTDDKGKIVDERHIRHATHPEDEALWAALTRGERAFEVFDNAPLVAHSGDRTRVVGRGWFVKTPIVDGEQPLGLFYNDSVLSGATLQLDVQELVAAFSMFIGPQLRIARDRSWASRWHGLSSEIAECLERLAAEPGVSQAELAERLGVTPYRLSRVFYRETGMQLQTYRTELRLERFFALVEGTRAE
jgi:hypothetical protein